MFVYLKTKNISKKCKKYVARDRYAKKFRGLFAIFPHIYNA